MKKPIFLVALSILLTSNFCNAQAIITQVAGNEAPGVGYTGNGGPATAAQLNACYMAFDAAGNLYITDYINSNIRKINTAGIIDAYVGSCPPGSSSPCSGGYSGDGGPATAAQISSPMGIITDVSGNVYFADGGNNVIRKINNAGIITTIAGNGIGRIYRRWRPCNKCTIQ